MDYWGGLIARCVHRYLLECVILLNTWGRWVKISMQSVPVCVEGVGMGGGAYINSFCLWVWSPCWATDCVSIQTAMW